jgi:hypothetical protein
VGEPLQEAPRHGDTEEVDAVVVTAVPWALPARRVTASVVPAVQAAAVAATGFVAGAALVGLASRRAHRRELVPAGAPRRIGRRSTGIGKRGQGKGGGEVLQIVGTRSLLVDVHLLAGGD